MLASRFANSYNEVSPDKLSYNNFAITPVTIFWRKKDLTILNGKAAHKIMTKLA